MNSKKFFLSCFSVSALIFSTPLWSQQKDHNIFSDDDESDISIVPVIEYDFSNEGDFSTSGGNTGTFELENGLGFGLDVQVPVNNSNLRFEGNFRYRKADLDSVNYERISLGGGNYAPDSLVSTINKSVEFSGSANQVSIGGSVYYDIDTGSDITPYVGAGIHYNHVTINDVNVSAGDLNARYNDDSGSLGYSLGVGVNYAVSDNVDVGVGYRYRQDFAGYEFEGTTDGKATTLDVDNFGSHSVMAGITVRF